VGPDLPSDLATIARFNQRHGSGPGMTAAVDTLELKAPSVGQVTDTLHRIPADLQAYLEIPLDQDPAQLVQAIARLGGRAKIRTGGVTRESFPRAPDLIRFMAAAIVARVPFKATAGLHHPLRAEYRLTYAPDSPRAPMFGFLNLFLTASFLSAGLDRELAVQLLEETSPQALQIEEDSIAWRGHRLGVNDLRRIRQEVIISFGSCSFTEPLSDLNSLHLLQSRVPQA
jgi:hypothetical protein